ncbi:hypothetical protein ACFUJ0_00215 [Streptomyces sp. NPDC057242]|uniref:hypothetical protein n=1 Tax=unclassified Streptomyces TaxID=2593676 RepID=UPI0036365C37
MNATVQDGSGAVITPDATEPPVSEIAYGTALGHRYEEGSDELPIVSECGSQASRADDAAGESEQAEVEIGTYPVAGTEAWGLVQP